MKVCVAAFDRVPAGKGASAHILANVRALAREHAVSLIALGDAPIAGLHHRPLKLAEPNWWLRGHAFARAVAAITDDYEFDAFHVRSPWEGLAVPPDRPIVYEVNALYSIEVHAHYPAAADRPEIRKRLRDRERALFERAARVVTPSAVTRDLLAHLGVRAEVIPNAPAIAIGAGAVEEREVLRLCYVGSLAAWQGVRELVATLAGQPGWTLGVWTGAHKDERKELERACRKLGVDGRVAIHDAVAPGELGAVLRAHDVGVAPLLPSERNLVQGCQPIKLLDYAAAGLPILAPDLPVVHELLGADYPTYDRWHRGDLVRALDRLRARSYRAELAARGLALAAGRAARQEALLLALYRGLA